MSDETKYPLTIDTTKAVVLNTANLGTSPSPILPHAAEAIRKAIEENKPKPKEIECPPNSHFLGVIGDDIAIMMPIAGRIRKRHALEVAAWLVALADDDNEFPAILEAVQNS